MNNKRRLIIAGVWKMNKTVAEPRGLAIVEGVGGQLFLAVMVALGQLVWERVAGRKSVLT